MAKQYEATADTLYSSTSPEHKNREKLQLIKTTESATDEYHDVLLFSAVENLVSWRTFHFNKNQVTEMDQKGEEGRKYV